jgi:hypothetical protein
VGFPILDLFGVQNWLPHRTRPHSPRGLPRRLRQGRGSVPERGGKKVAFGPARGWVHRPWWKRSAPRAAAGKRSAETGIARPAQVAGPPRFDPGVPGGVFLRGPDRLASSGDTEVHIGRNARMRRATSGGRVPFLVDSGEDTRSAPAASPWHRHACAGTNLPTSCRRGHGLPGFNKGQNRPWGPASDGNLSGRTGGKPSVDGPGSDPDMVARIEPRSGRGAEG